LPIGLFHQLIEHRIVEDAPPISVIGQFRSDPLVVLVDPTVCNRRSRLTVLGSDFESVVNVVFARANVVFA
jgi:hypothetical protein